MQALEPAGIDVLVLAGDIGNAATIGAGLQLICTRYSEAAVLFVAGNHEYYRSCPADVEQELRELEARTPNLTVLNNRTTTIEGVVFAGTTLWFPFDELNKVYASRLADFSAIDNFVPWVYEQNEEAVAFLRRAAPIADVVITHHVPSYQAITPQWLGSALNRFFVCEMGDLIAKAQPGWWFFGHTHTPGNFAISGTRMLTNPFGYPLEAKADFNDRLVINALAKTGCRPCS